MQKIIGSVINNRYKVESLIGRGGMAEVYMAKDTRLETRDAIKFIRVDRFPQEVIQSIIKRFENEAKKMAQLSHPNIVKVSDYGSYEGVPFLVMEYMPNGTLKQYLGKPMPIQQAAGLLLPLAEALAYTHAKGIIHRDVKPTNILLSETGSPMLSDFGVAKMMDSTQTQGLTATGASIGTPEYMAPEQAIGKQIDQRVDIYSLGVILYELVTGRRPYSADTPMELIIKQSRDPLPPPSTIVKNLPQNAEKVIQKALEKEPNDRFTDMKAFADALITLADSRNNTSVIEERVEKKKASQKASSGKQRLPIGWIAGGLAVAVGVIAYFSLFNSGPTETTGAEEPKEKSSYRITANVKKATATASLHPMDISVISFNTAESGRVYRTIKDGAEQAGEELGMTVTYTAPDFDNSNDVVIDQITLLEDAIAIGSDALCVYAIDPNAVVPVLEKANDAGISVISLVNEIDNSVVDATVSFDFSAMGAEAADRMADAIGGEGMISIIGGIESSYFDSELVNGFVNRLAAYPNIRVMIHEYGNYDVQQSLSIAMDILTINPEIDGIFTSNPFAMSGVLAAVEASGLDGITLISIEATTDQMEDIRSGLLTGAILSDSYNMGYKCIKAAVEANNGESLPGFIDSGFRWADAANIDDPEVNRILKD